MNSEHLDPIGPVFYQNFEIRGSRFQIAGFVKADGQLVLAISASGRSSTALRRGGMALAKLPFRE